MTNRDALVSIPGDVRFRLVADEAVVLVQERSTVIGVNQVGGRLLELVREKGAAPLGSLLDALAGEYAVEPGELEATVVPFVEELAERGVLRIVAGPP